MWIPFCVCDSGLCLWGFLGFVGRCPRVSESLCMPSRGFDSERRDVQSLSSNRGNKTPSDLRRVGAWGLFCSARLGRGASAASLNRHPKASAHPWVCFASAAWMSPRPPPSFLPCPRWWCGRASACCRSRCRRIFDVFLVCFASAPQSSMLAVQTCVVRVMCVSGRPCELSGLLQLTARWA